MDRNEAASVIRKYLTCTDITHSCNGKCKACRYHTNDDEKELALRLAIAALDDKDINVPTKWIPVSEKLPEEHDTMFAKYWGTDRWNEYMFRGRSELVEVTVELEDGTRYTDASRTRDWKWDIEERHGAVKKKVVAWHYMSDPWKGE